MADAKGHEANASLAAARRDAGMRGEPGGAPDPRVNRVLQEYLERIDRGEQIDPEEYLRKHAEIAHELRSFISDATGLARQIEPPRDAVAEASTNQSLSETVAPVSAGATATLPEAFGRYRVQRLLGRGAMGSVYLAHDTQLSRRVALKIPSFGGGESDELLQRFYREARAAATLQHPNICPVYDVGEIDGQHFISMAFIEGHALSEILKANGAQPERQVLLVVRKLALALQDAHDAGIIHRDLKPGNVMVDARGEPIVMDFGLACQQREGGERLTHSGVILGSPAYMSPEQLEGQSTRITPAADQYALGVMLYELLTGELPFRGSISAVISRIVTRPAPSPRLIRPELDPRIDELCLQMLSKTAAGRYPSMKAVADRMLAILKEPPRPDVTPASAAEPKALEPAGETAAPGRANVRQKVADLVKRGDYPAALAILEPLARGESGKLADWAREQQTRIRQELQRYEQDHSTLLLLAAKLIRKHDYTEAIRVLCEVPAAQRSEELQDLLNDAEAKEEEASLLLKDIEEAIREDQPKELPQFVKRMLQLKPGNRAVQQLAADLKKYGPEQVIRVRRGRRVFLDPAGQVWNPLHIAGFCVGLTAVCLLVYFSVIAFQTPRGTVIVEVHDPRISVQFFGDEITATTSGKRFRLRPTERRTLELQVDGVTVDASSQEISVAHNETKLISARLISGKPELTISGERIFPAAGSSGGDVLAPGGAQAVSKAEGHGTENAWIDLLSDADPAAASRRLFQWTRDGQVVRGVLNDAAENGWMHLGLPQEIRGDYDLEVEFLVEGSRYVQFGLPLDDTAVSASFGKGGSTLHSIDGEDLNGQGRIARPYGNLEARLESGKSQKVTVSVRHDGQNVTVVTTLNGVPAGSFAGLRSRLSKPGANAAAHRNVLLVAEILDRTPGRRFEIHRARARLVASSSQTAAADPAGAKAVDDRSGRVVLDVDFRKTSGGFDLRDQHHIRTEWRDGEYHFVGKKEGFWFHQVHRALFAPENAAMKNLLLELDVRMVGGTRGRFAVEFGRTKQDRLFLVLDHQGRVSLLAGSPDENVELLAPTRPDVMHPVDEFNTLSITVNDGRLQFSVNGTQIYRFGLKDFTGVPVQPWIWAGETPLDVRLRRLRMEEPAAEPNSPAAPAAAAPFRETILDVDVRNSNGSTYRLHVFPDRTVWIARCENDTGNDLLHLRATALSRPGAFHTVRLEIDYGQSRIFVNQFCAAECSPSRSTLDPAALVRSPAGERLSSVSFRKIGLWPRRESGET